MLAGDSTGESAVVAGGTVVVVGVTVLGASATDDTGPILAFVGAVLVALIAAYTAGRRQARALEAESGRLAQQLDHESKRVAEQLEHDRELADLAAVRSVLDEAALVLQRVRPLPPALLLNEKEFKRVDEIRKTLFDPIRSRLTVRFGPQHALVRLFGQAADTLGNWSIRAWSLTLTEEERGSRDAGDVPAKREEAMNVLDRHAETFRSVTSRFLDAAAKTAGARLP